MDQYLHTASRIVEQLLATQGQAGFADALIIFVSFLTILVVLSVIRTGQRARTAGSADGGVRGKLERIERMLNELKTERARLAAQSQKEIQAIKHEVQTLQKKAS